MGTFNDVVRKFKELQSEIVSKGGKVRVAHTNPSPDELIAGIKSIEINRPLITAANGYVIIVGERPGTKIKLFKDGEQEGSELTVGETGYVTFTVDDIGYYTAKAYRDADVEVWTNGVSVVEAGVYNIKVGIPMENYTWDELNEAAADGYIKYMFNPWDSKKLPSFMGRSDAQYTTAYLIGTNHDYAAAGGKAGATFMIPRTYSSYKHWNTSNTNENGISWVGSLIFQNCLKSGDVYYTYDTTVTAETSGTYYVFDDVNNDFVEQTLPENYVESTKYYKKGVAEQDGAFIAGLPEDFIKYLVKVKKKTWAGFGGDVSNTTLAGLDTKVIETENLMFAPAVCEVFGTTNRFTTYDKALLEGEQYEAFKEFHEDRICSSGSYSRWFRSPCVSDSRSFCYWINTG